MRFRPAVAKDLDAIAHWLSDHYDPQSAARRMDEIQATIVSLERLPHKSSRHDGTVPGLRTIPAGRRALIAFTADDDTRKVDIHAITYAGSDWISRSEVRRYCDRHIFLPSICKTLI